MFSNTAIKNNFRNNLLFTRHSQANAFSTSHHVTFFTKYRCVETKSGAPSLS